jgi:hypothetical protein
MFLRGEIEDLCNVILLVLLSPSRAKMEPWEGEG